MTDRYSTPMVLISLSTALPIAMIVPPSGATAVERSATIANIGDEQSEGAEFADTSKSSSESEWAAGRWHSKEWPDSPEVQQARAALDSKDYDKAINDLRPLAESGDPNAEAIVGWMYCFGRGVSKNEDEGALWLRKAADQGHKRALQNLAYLHDEQKNYVQAVEAWKVLAEEGDSYAEFRLGSAYRYGTSVNEDIVEALRWLRKASDQDDAIATKELADIVANQTGENKHATQALYQKAVRLYRKSIDMHNDPSGYYAYGLATMYEQKLIPTDPVEAKKWYQQAVEKRWQLATAPLDRLVAAEREGNEAIAELSPER